jgi:LPS sulfotransferase NodH
MAAKTLHIYRSGEAWTVKKVGKFAKTFPTQQKAVAAARKSIRDAGSGQLVVYGINGLIRHHATHRMIRIQKHPKKSPIAAQIERAVAKVVLQRVQSSPPREHSAKK